MDNSKAAAQRIEVPDLTSEDIAFGNIKHMPRYEAIPDVFECRGNRYRRAISSWFFRGGRSAPNGICLDGITFTAKPGIDEVKALVAIKAVLGSWEPKHEHKIAACAFMLSQWFDIVDGEGGATC